MTDLLNRVLFFILKKTVGKYIIEDFTLSQLQSSIYAGTASICDLHANVDTLNKTLEASDVPFRLRSVYIGTLHAKTDAVGAFFSSARSPSLQIQLEGVHVVLEYQGPPTGEDKEAASDDKTDIQTVISEIFERPTDKEIHENFMDDPDGDDSSLPPEISEFLHKKDTTTTSSTVSSTVTSSSPAGSTVRSGGSSQQKLKSQVGSLIDTLLHKAGLSFVNVTIELHVPKPGGTGHNILLLHVPSLNFEDETVRNAKDKLQSKLYHKIAKFGYVMLQVYTTPTEHNGSPPQSPPASPLHAPPSMTQSFHTTSADSDSDADSTGSCKTMDMEDSVYTQVVEGCVGENVNTTQGSNCDSPKDKEPIAYLNRSRYVLCTDVSAENYVTLTTGMPGSDKDGDLRLSVFLSYLHGVLTPTHVRILREIAAVLCSPEEETSGENEYVDCDPTGDCKPIDIEFGRGTVFYFQLHLEWFGCCLVAESVNMDGVWDACVQACHDRVKREGPDSEKLATTSDSPCSPVSDKAEEQEEDNTTAADNGRRLIGPAREKLGSHLFIQLKDFSCHYQNIKLLEFCNQYGMEVNTAFNLQVSAAIVDPQTGATKSKDLLAFEQLEQTDFSARPSEQPPQVGVIVSIAPMERKSNTQFLSKNLIEVAIQNVATNIDTSTLEQLSNWCDNVIKETEVQAPDTPPSTPCAPKHQALIETLNSIIVDFKSWTGNFFFPYDKASKYFATIPALRTMLKLKDIAVTCEEHEELAYQLGVSLEKGRLKTESRTTTTESGIVLPPQNGSDTKWAGSIGTLEAQLLPHMKMIGASLGAERGSCIDPVELVPKLDLKGTGHGGPQSVPLYQQPPDPEDEDDTSDLFTTRTFSAMEDQGIKFSKVQGKALKDKHTGAYLLIKDATLDFVVRPDAPITEDEAEPYSTTEPQRANMAREQDVWDRAAVAIRVSAPKASLDMQKRGFFLLQWMLKTIADGISPPRPVPVYHPLADPLPPDPPRHLIALEISIVDSELVLHCPRNVPPKIQPGAQEGRSSQGNVYPQYHTPIVHVYSADIKHLRVAIVIHSQESALAQVNVYVKGVALYEHSGQMAEAGSAPTKEEVITLLRSFDQPARLWEQDKGMQMNDDPVCGLRVCLSYHDIVYPEVREDLSLDLLGTQLIMYHKVQPPKENWILRFVDFLSKYEQLPDDENYADVPMPQNVAHIAVDDPTASEYEASTKVKIEFQQCLIQYKPEKYNGQIVAVPNSVVLQTHVLKSSNVTKLYLTFGSSPMLLNNNYTHDIVSLIGQSKLGVVEDLELGAFVRVIKISGLSVVISIASDDSSVPVTVELNNCIGNIEACSDSFHTFFDYLISYMDNDDISCHLKEECIATAADENKSTVSWIGTEGGTHQQLPEGFYETTSIASGVCVSVAKGQGGQEGDNEDEVGAQTKASLLDAIGYINPMFTAQSTPPLTSVDGTWKTPFEIDDDHFQECEGPPPDNLDLGFEQVDLTLQGAPLPENIIGLREVKPMVQHIQEDGTVTFEDTQSTASTEASDIMLATIGQNIVDDARQQTGKPPIKSDITYLTPESQPEQPPDTPTVTLTQEFFTKKFIPSHFDVPDMVDYSTKCLNTPLPANYPRPDVQVKIQDVSVKCDLIGGHDFTPEPKRTATASTTTTSTAPHRDNNQLIKVDIEDLFVRVDIFDDDNKDFRIQVGAHSVKVIDHVKCSDRYFMVAPKRVVNSDPLVHPVHKSLLDPTFVITWEGIKTRTQDDLEHRLDIQLIPLRINIDQDAAEFLTAFLTPKPTKLNPNTPKITPKPPNPNNPEGLLYFQNVTISSIALKVDYKPKHLDFSELRKGQYVQLVNVCTLQNIEVTLPTVSVNGCKGPAQLGLAIFEAYAPTISKSELLMLLCGFQPLRAVKNVSSSTLNMFLLPFHFYNKDKALFAGLQKGMTEFARTFAVEAVDLTGAASSSMQAAMETVRVSRATDSQDNVYGHPQPATTLEGIAQAYSALSKGIRQSANVLLSIPDQSARNNEGYITYTMFRALPLMVLEPVIGALEAVSTTMQGIHNHIDPKHRNEMQHIYKPSN